LLNTYQQRHLWSEHGTHSTKHGSYAEQRHTQFGGEHLCGEHVHGIKCHGDGVLAAQEQQQLHPQIICKFMMHGFDYQGQLDIHDDMN